VDRYRLECAAFIHTYLGLWRQHFSQNRWRSWLCSKLHCTTFQKPVIFMLTPMRKAYITFRPWSCGQYVPQNLEGHDMYCIIWCYVLESCKSHTDGIRTSSTKFRSWRRQQFAREGLCSSTRRLNSPKWEPQLSRFYFEVWSSGRSSSILLPRLNFRTWKWVHSPITVGNK